MKIFYSLLFLIIFSASLLKAQQSTTGPLPTESIDVRGYESTENKNITSETLISGVAAYMWRHGCGPTALGMVIAYYDEHGFPNLIPGSSASQTAIVQQIIASDANYNDYCLPEDSYPNLLADLSELPAGDEHTDNCIADFMKTSRSVIQNYYGWSWSSDIETAFTAYLAYNGNYSGTAAQHDFSTYNFGAMQAEIDANHPMMALVDTDADGYTDHFVTIIGYKQVSGINYYACYNTWDSNVHWYPYVQICGGVSWGIYSLFTFSMNSISGIESSQIANFNITPNPAQNYITLSGDHSANCLISIYNVSGQMLMTKTLEAEESTVNIEILPEGLYFLIHTDSKGKNTSASFQKTF